MVKFLRKIRESSREPRHDSGKKKSYNSRETKSDDTIGLGDLCLLLKLTEDGVLVKLSVLNDA